MPLFTLCYFYIHNEVFFGFFCAARDSPAAVRKHIFVITQDKLEELNADPP